MHLYAQTHKATPLCFTASLFLYIARHQLNYKLYQEVQDFPAQLCYNNSPLNSGMGFRLLLIIK